MEAKAHPPYHLWGEGKSVKAWCLCTIAALATRSHKWLFLTRTIAAPFLGELPVCLEKRDMYFWEEKNALHSKVQTMQWNL